MKSAKIFLVEGRRKLTPMTNTTYVKEDDLQALLADYPDLLPGEQIDPDNPRRWLLVKRELGVPGSEDETGRWSLDHLFLDQDGVPTFVECKRSVDTRGRREVVAQMLDYAANGISYWKLEDLRKAAEETARKRGSLLEDEIQRLTESHESKSVDDYWKQVELNLKAGIVRLIFVSDAIPRELRRLVEFLNEQMTNVQVLAVEVKQFAGEQEQSVLVPALIGMTETARDIKSQSHRTNRDEFLEECTPEASEFFQRILEAARKHRYEIYWGTSGFSIRISLPEKETLASVAYGYPPNTFQIFFGHLDWPETQIAALRKEILAFQIFKESPKTVTAKIEAQHVEKAIAAFETMLKRVDPLGSAELQG